MTLARVLVIGTGLIGASVGLALSGHGIEVQLSDRDPRRLGLAADLGAGRAVRDIGAPKPGTEPFDLVLLCVPPEAVPRELIKAQRLDLGWSYSDVASIKTQPQREAEHLGIDATRFVGGHPVAGRERSGPGNARADLFLGRPWVLTPSRQSSQQALDAARRLALLCGARPLLLTPEQHDAAVALTSHLPQAVASVLASQLVNADGETLELAGQGFRDMTRIADSDPDLWAQIAAGNAEPLAQALRGVSTQLDQLARALERGDPGAAERAFRETVAEGNAGRGRLPGKHGEARQSYESVSVVIVDEPGALARLLADAGEAGVNVEDLSVEHSPGAPVGLCELQVRPDQADRLTTQLRKRGWSVHQTGDRIGSRQGRSRA